ncbi:hypothetical protein AVEN_205235-1 [Araneus ventricosus]|uniref:Uncharacterized protein n=1 Tax=Araneus ventricosus TaxID=182803 RepID=A0A4Y2IEI5_ARAVE|nr:hypothetical protein AVEN_205235-1 [Araneus ventricosus]
MVSIATTPLTSWNSILNKLRKLLGTARVLDGESSEPPSTFAENVYTCSTGTCFQSKYFEECLAATRYSVQQCLPVADIEDLMTRILQCNPMSSTINV